MTDIEMAGDNGELRVPYHQISAMSSREYYQLNASVSRYVLAHPGMQLNMEDDNDTGDLIIRWRTRHADSNKGGVSAPQALE